MANPFLVLGGVAVGVITAGIGVLSVPGWIDSAHDSAAMNDLANIRTAQSAAVLQLGSYTDDLTVLRSGDLGVRAQPSDGVTLVGLDANGNETWCAAVQSESGRYFAASHVNATIATGTGAAAATAAAACDPESITAIAAPSAAPLGAVVNLSAPYRAIWTPQGVYAAYGNGAAQFARSGADGRAHAVSPTGPITGGAYVSHENDLRADPAGNLYVAAIAPDGSGGWGSGIYRIAPDETTSLIQFVPGYSLNSTVSPDGVLYYVTDGEVWKITDPGAATPGAPTRVGSMPSGWTGEATLTADSHGNVFAPTAFGESSSIVKMSADGSTSTISVKDGSGAAAGIDNFTAAADGTLYGTSGGSIVRVTTGGVRTVIGAPHSDFAGWTKNILPNLVTLDPAGNLYFTDRTDSHAVFRLTPGGQYSVVMGS